MEFPLNTLLLVKKSGPEHGTVTSLSPAGVFSLLLQPLINTAAVIKTTNDTFINFERASQEAYNKSLETLEKEKMPEILNSILQ